MLLEKNKALKLFNTFGINAVAKEFATVDNFQDLQECLGYAKRSGSRLLVLGGGSNILLTKDFDGLVLKNEISGIAVVGEDAEKILLKAGAGVNWHSLVEYCLQHNYAGIENLALIPGNTGASPMQNIGAYGVELKDTFHSLTAIQVSDGSVVQFKKEDCNFGYRDSVFKNKYKGQFVIADITLALNKNPVFHTSYGAIEAELERMQVKELSIKSIASAVINIRRSKLPDPAVIGNAGSFFKNPEIDLNHYDNLKQRFPGIIGYKTTAGKIKLAAGWLIEQCGWKGFRQGDAGCHTTQALVLVNYGNASGNEIVELTTEIQKSVYERFGVELTPEVNIY